MNDNKLFADSICEGQANLAERELSAFIQSVTELFGPEQARISAEDWLEEAGLIDSRPLAAERGWRWVSIAASARLASRVNAVQPRRKSAPASTAARVLPKLSSDCFASMLLS